MLKKIIILIFFFIYFSSAGAKASRSYEFNESRGPELSESTNNELTIASAFVNCPNDKTVTLNSGCNIAVNWTAPSPSNPAASLESTHNPGDLFDIGKTEVTYFEKNSSGDIIAQCTFTINVEPESSYALSNCPGDITSTLTENCDRRQLWFEPDVACGLELASNYQPGDKFPIGTTTVNYTAFKDGVIYGSCSFTVTLIDNFAPVFDFCPSNITVNANENCEAVVNWTSPEASDNCGFTPTLTSNFSNGSTFPIGTTTVTYTATDEGDNTATCSFDVIVKDNTAPEFTNIPTAVKVDANANCKAVANWDAITATDNCSSTITINSNYNSGDLFNIGETTIDYTATDDAGNETIANFKVIVEDNASPVTTNCPSNIMVTANENCEATATWNVPTFSDSCDASPLVNASHSPGDTFPIGDTEVSYTATDDAGNQTICSFIVTVEDNTPPDIISQLQDLVVSTNDDDCEAIVNWNEIRAEDQCDSNVQIMSNFNSGDIFGLGESIVKVTATDNAGNETVDSFKVTVEDNSLPIIVSCPNDVNVSAEGNCEAIATWAIPEFSDNCDTNLSIASNHNPGENFPLGTTTVTYTATDDNGNERTCSFDVMVEDDTAPVFTKCVADVKLSANNQCEAIAEWAIPTVTDNCDSNIALESDIASGTVFQLGSTTVTYTATDNAGNTSSCSFQVVVEDTRSPVVVTSPEKITLAANTNCYGIADWQAPTFKDCSNLSISSTVQPGDTLPIGTTVVEYTATDRGGNSVVCSFEVEIVDETPPVVENCIEDINISTSDNCEAIVEWDSPVVSDNCSDVTISSNYQSGTSFPVGLTTIEYEFVDENGNKSFCNFDINVLDESEIIVNNCPENIQVKAENNKDTAIVSWEEPTAIAECSDVSVQTSHQPGNTFRVGTTVVTYTFTTQNEQTVTCTFEVTVVPVVLEVEVSKLLTPNGDRDNDSWLIEGIEQFPDNQVIIVDRWGAEIFSAKGYNNDEIIWSGENNNGELVPRGTYYYFISVRNEQDKIEKKGFLEVLR